MITPYHYQEDLSNDALEVIRNNGFVYLAMEERTGKTLTAILTAEKSKAEKVLVITKKKALEGWYDTFKSFVVTKHYTVVNYHQAYKHAASDFDLVILDESHNYISAFPKPGKIWKELQPMLANVPVIYVSATPHAQGPQMLFHQLALCSWSPWTRYKNFYEWFRMYGKPYTKEINSIKVPQYDRCHEQTILDCVQQAFITKTRKELDFEHEPEDKLHYIELGEATRKVYNHLLEHELIDLSVGTLVCDSKSKLRTSLHQLEGGTIKIDEGRHVLANNEKADYILENFGDRDDLVIMYNFKAELVKLQLRFKHALLLQATSYAEGVDLHKYSDLIIYSQDYSTARHTQRRARQCNKQRRTPITVHYLLVKNAISSQVYRTVSVNKKNYVDSVFNKEWL